MWKTCMRICMVESMGIIASLAFLGTWIGVTYEERKEKHQLHLSISCGWSGLHGIYTTLIAGHCLTWEER